MRQRVALFSAFIGRRELVLLDEPFNWLDPMAAYDLKEAIAATARAGAPVLSALHDLATFVGRCDGGLLLDAGAPVRTFSADDLVARRADVLGFEREIYAGLKARG